MLFRSIRAEFGSGKGSSGNPDRLSMQDIKTRQTALGQEEANVLRARAQDLNDALSNEDKKSVRDRYQTRLDEIAEERKDLKKRMDRVSESLSAPKNSPPSLTKPKTLNSPELVRRN